MATDKNSDKTDRKKEMLFQVLRQSNGNRSEAAKILGISRVTVWKQIKKYGINLAPDWDRIKNQSQI